MPTQPRSLVRPATCTALVLVALWLAAPAAAWADAPQNQVADAARDWLRVRVAQQGIQATRLDVDVIPPARRPAPCPQRWRIEILKAMPGRVLLGAECPAGKGGQSRYTVRTAIRAKVLVARSGIAGGRVLEASMLDTAEQDISLSPDALTDPAQAVGHTLLRPLGAGKLLLSRFLASDHGVHRGQQVRIVAGAAGFQISIAGTALADAGLGEAVIVRNQSTGKTLAARVSGDGVVAPAMQTR
ncbi:flagellar basal body P-ring formation chaperone FlgA [Xanthomonas campestris pv. phormiicola]|nr:flagellar basal body P-ring formation chaperone FlgA [Xanthomonas campestris pv. phormiicola]UYC17839.1 flagellar basal body P-ring formation chaperone FlgA [Xanthomonas campestris pv. phormiicola]